MGPASELYICSSRRHLYVASGLARSSALHSHLLVIDQALDEPDAMVAALASESSLFESVTVWAKRRGRSGLRREKADIETLIKQIGPQRVFCGNDRKLQFQYAVYFARKAGRKCRGIYMDDGTGTYESGIHLSFWRGFFDKTVVAWAKKLSVGWWYDRPRYFGATRWVDECCVQHPQLLPDAVRQSREVSQLEADLYRSPETLAMLERCFLGSVEQDTAWSHCQALIVLPLGKHAPAPGSASMRSFAARVRQAVAGCEPVGIKYHPRESKHYLPPEQGDVIVDPAVPAEILFSRGEPRVIVGDTSSALLSAQWLQTDARIISLCPQGDENKPLPRLLARSGIPVEVYS